MKSKKFAINPNLLNYFGTIANAVNIARADPASITQYLTVAGQVLEVYEPKGANRFFGVSRTFFAHHALHYEKSYRLYARDDKYSFEFIVPETVTWEDPPAEEVQSGGLWEDEPAEETTYDLWESTPTDETTTDEYWTEDTTDLPAYAENMAPNQEMPGWITPPVQPLVEGPIIRFETLSLNRTTRSDSEIGRA